MKIIIKELYLASIKDQLDEQGINTTPLDVESIHILFFQGKIESDSFVEVKKETLLFNLMDWGIIEDIESIETTYDTIFQPKTEHRAEITLTLK
jgi:hypothetical protein